MRTFSWISSQFKDCVPFESIYGFVDVLAWILIFIGIVYWRQKKKRTW